MSQPNPSTAMARALIDELARGGVRLVVVSPGSRSAALAIAASEHPMLETRVALDERSAGFLALGRAKVTGEPSMVISTSGTAPANYFPAVVEADMSLTPLVVMSADRPSELRGVGANQTIDQTRLYGAKVRRFIDVPAPEPEDDLNDYWRSAAAEALARARGAGGRPGPVHVNVGFREPTVPVADDGRTSSAPYLHSIEGREDGGPWMVWDPPWPPALPELGDFGAERPVLVLGEGAYDRARVMGIAEASGWPVLATALSGLRGRGTVTVYHHLLAGGIPSSLRPDLAVVVGAVGPSTRLETLIGSARIRVRVDRWGRRLDPERTATDLFHADPVALLDELANTPVAREWPARWESAELTARKAMAEVVDSAPEPSGASTVHALDSAPWETMVAGSSLPIREVDAHLTRRGAVIANRGASGIDGIVSTARGVASAGTATVALAGDLSLLHDQNGLLIEGREDLVIVVLDNQGGGLFDSLPQAVHAPQYERLFVTPPHRDLALLARFHDIPYLTVTDREELIEAVTSGIENGGTHMVRVPVDRKIDLEMRKALDDAGTQVASRI
ncbi:MAG: 2-succinyl-5-enolpyruvyl-6-hydroxy-3-cyclohexene-1-carboxylic-acid synthase [Acidimicrobiia bacterium]